MPGSKGSAIFVPKKGPKRLSPLDNALFHIWKERVRKHACSQKIMLYKSCPMNGIVYHPNTFNHNIANAA